MVPVLLFGGLGLAAGAALVNAQTQRRQTPRFGPALPGFGPALPRRSMFGRQELGELQERLAKVESKLRAMSSRRSTPENWKKYHHLLERRQKLLTKIERREGSSYELEDSYGRGGRRSQQDRVPVEDRLEKARTKLARLVKRKARLKKKGDDEKLADVEEKISKVNERVRKLRRRMEKGPRGEGRVEEEEFDFDEDEVEDDEDDSSDFDDLDELEGYGGDDSDILGPSAILDDIDVSIQSDYADLLGGEDSPFAQALARAAAEESYRRQPTRADQRRQRRSEKRSAMEVRRSFRLMTSPQVRRHMRRSAREIGQAARNAIWEGHVTRHLQLFQTLETPVVIMALADAEQAVRTPGLTREQRRAASGQVKFLKAVLRLRGIDPDDAQEVEAALAA